MTDTQNNQKLDHLILSVFFFQIKKKEIDCDFKRKKKNNKN